MFKPGMCKMWPAVNYQKHRAKGIKFDEFLFCANSYETLKYKFCGTNTACLQ